MKLLNFLFVKINKLSLFIYIFILSILLVLSMRSTALIPYTMDEITVFVEENIIFSLIKIIFLIFIAFFIYKINSHQKVKRYLWIIYFLYICLIIYLIFDISLYPTWDAYKTFYYANEFLNGNYEGAYAGAYISKYPFQIPMIYYNILLIKLFGNNFFVPQIINSIYIIGIIYFISRMSFELYDHVQGTISSILLVTFIPLGLYAIFIYSNIPSCFYMYFAIYLFIKLFNHEKTYFIIIPFIPLIIAILLKGTSYIVLIAMIIVYSMKLIYQKKLKSTLIIIFLLFATVNIPKLVNHYVSSLDSNIKISENFFVPYALEMGSKRSSRGAGWHESWILNHIDAMEASQQEKKNEIYRIIKENYSTLFRSKSDAYYFYKDKVGSMWINPEFQGFWTIVANKQNQIENKKEITSLFPSKQTYLLENHYHSFTASFLDGKLNKIILFYLNSLQTLIYLCALIDAIYLLKNHSYDLKYLLLPYIFIGAFVFFLFWEAKAQYSILFYLLLFVNASNGLNIIFTTLNRALNSISFT